MQAFLMMFLFINEKSTEIPVKIIASGAKTDQNADNIQRNVKHANAK